MKVVIPTAINQTVSGQVLASVRGQSVEPEIVVVATPGAVDREELVSVKRRHAMVSRNLCVQLIRSERYAVMQDSDVCHETPFNLEEMVARLESEADIGAVSLPEPTARSRFREPHSSENEPLHVWVGCVLARREVWSELEFNPDGLCACRQIGDHARSLGLRHVYLDLDRSRVTEENPPQMPKIRIRTRFGSPKGG